MSSATAKISDSVSHARLTAALLELDERDDLSPEEEALAEVLTLLIEDDEEKYHPLPSVSPNESLKALMEERGLSGRRSVSKAQAKRLAEFLHVPVDLFT